MKFHWKVLAWMIAGILVGLGLQLFVEGTPYTGLVVVEHVDGVAVAKADGPSSSSKLTAGEVLVALVEDRDQKAPRVTPLARPEDLENAIAHADIGGVLWLRTAKGREVSVPVELAPSSIRAKLVTPFAFAGDIFLALLKMLIMPLIFASIVSGVAGLGSALELRRMGLKTFGYYTASSLAAILVGQLFVNVLSPGSGAALGLAPVIEAGVAPDASFVEVLKRMVPSNVFASLTDNGAMLQVIFFALVFGYCVTITPAPHAGRVRDLADSILEVMMRLAGGVLQLIPYGVFALLVKVVAVTGSAIFKPLALYMFTVVAALLVHAAVVLPLVLKVFARVHPRRWFEAMGPALLTAFSTSSSSMTLPVTLDTVERRGFVSKKVASFTLPLGATINMDGTALYECVGVIFLAQYYASVGGFELTLASQAMVVVMALLASIGAAGIPSAGLVMMLTILAALGLPLEGAALLLAVDRPLDMLRTTVNVWSDSVAAAVIARSEGEAGPATVGEGQG